MKKLLVSAIACLATAASAGGNANSSTSYESGIVTPEQARGFFATHLTKIDTNGDLVVCPYDAGYQGGKCMNAFKEVPLVPMAKSIPAGRTFVGFRVVSGGGGYRHLEIYYR